MPRTVRAALLQTEWTGDKESMIDRHEEAARDAAAQGAQVMCFQELFYGPYFCYHRHCPEGWRALGLNGAEIVFNPSATSRGLSSYLWKLEQPAAAVANEYYIGAINRVGIEPLGDDDFYGTSYFVDPEGKFVGDVGHDHDAELMVRDLDMDVLTEVRNRWAFYRDRRPDA